MSADHHLAFLYIIISIVYNSIGIAVPSKNDGDQRLVREATSTNEASRYTHTRLSVGRTKPMSRTLDQDKDGDEKEKKRLKEYLIIKVPSSTFCRYPIRSRLLWRVNTHKKMEDMEDGNKKINK